MVKMTNLQNFMIFNHAQQVNQSRLLRNMLTCEICWDKSHNE